MFKAFKYNKDYSFLYSVGFTDEMVISLKELKRLK